MATPTRQRRHAGFTLIEILVVVAIIVLMIAMAVPLFNTLTGSRSEESAENQIAAMLNTARTEAMALQVPTGVLFYLDPKTDRVGAVLVREVQTELTNHPETIKHQVEIFLDLMDREPVLLPPGITLQTIDDAEYDAGVSQPQPSDYKDDRYVGFTRMGGTIESIPMGGVILFDGRGQVISRRVAYPYAAKGSDGKWRRSAIAQLMYSDAQTDPTFLDQSGLAVFGATHPRTRFGLVLFNREAFRGAGNTEEDVQSGGISYKPNEQKEEEWIDANAIPLIVNRYNGTLIRGEP